jgi:GNAT superfamily N-acetyltransferase
MPPIRSIVSIARAARNVEAECELVLRSLPLWFAQEDSLLEYVRGTSHLPTFVSTEANVVNGFVSLQQHFPQSFEIVCVAVHAASRGRGIGRALLEHASGWASEHGGRFLQVKTIAASHPSPEYAQTRAFYESVGFAPLEVFPTLWTAKHPCLQLVKHLHNEAHQTFGAPNAHRR